MLFLVLYEFFDSKYLTKLKVSLINVFLLRTHLNQVASSIGQNILAKEGS